MLLFVYYMICWGFKNSVIRKFPITEFLLAKRKRYVSTLNLTLMTVIIYTGNKVKSNRGREENQLTYWYYFLFASNEILYIIFRKPHSTAGKFAPKTTFFIKVFSFVFLVPEKRIIFAKVQRRIKSKIRLSYRLSFKLLVVNQSNMLHRQVSGDYQRLAYIINDYQGVHFERLSFQPYKRQLSFIGLIQLIFVPHLLLAC